jgi:hypothetical protein
MPDRDYKAERQALYDAITEATQALEKAFLAASRAHGYSGHDLMIMAARHGRSRKIVVRLTQVTFWDKLGISQMP